MGKPTGFLDFQRELPTDRSPLGRVADYKEFHEHMPEAELMTIMEAARWAPSSYNSQPAKFLYARRGTPHWDRFFGLLGEFNQSWAKDASVLIVMVSNSLMQPPGRDKPVPARSPCQHAQVATAAP